MPENPTPAEAEGLVQTAQKLPSPTEAFYRRLLPALKVSSCIVSIIRHVRKQLWYSLLISMEAVPPLAALLGHSMRVALPQEAGLSSSVAREKWPVEALKKVVQDLGADIPPQLLERELSRGARSAADWLQRQRAYARSAAVMSMVCAPLRADLPIGTT